MIKTYLISLLSFISLINFGQTNFTADQLQEDAQLLWHALNELHPGLYKHTDTVSLRNEYEQLLEDLSEDRSPEESFLLFSKFSAKIKCGHTYVNPFNQSNGIIKKLLEKKVLLPFTFSIIDSKIIVEQAFNKSIQKHAIITHINSVAVTSILDSLTNYIKADGDRYMKRIKDLEVSLSSKYEYFDYYFPMIYKFEDSVTLRYEDGSEQDIPLMNKIERKAFYEALNANINQNSYDNLWSYHFTDDYAYLKLGTFVTWRLSFDYEEYIDQFFTNLEQKNIAHLIIDVRGNEGGLSDVNDYLLHKIAKNQGQTVFRKPHLAYKNVSEQIRPHVSTWSKRFYKTSLWTKKLNDHYRTIRFSANKPKKIKKNKNAYQGDTYLLINESNSSATFILSEICKKNNYATLIGTETGGTKKGITAGQIFFLTLPNTKIEIDLPLIGRYPMTDLPDEGVKPDILVQQTLAGYINNQDEPLEKVIELIKTK